MLNRLNFKKVYLLLTDMVGLCNSCLLFEISMLFHMTLEMAFYQSPTFDLCSTALHGSACAKTAECELSVISFAINL